MNVLNNNRNQKFSGPKIGLAITIIILELTSPLSLVRLLFGNQGLVFESTFGAAILAFSVICWWLVVRKKRLRVSRYAWCVAIFFGFTFLRLRLAGVPAASLWGIATGGWCAFCVASLINQYFKPYIFIIMIGIIVNAATLVFPNAGFQANLDSVTVAGSLRNESVGGLFGTRSTGLLGIAGTASFYSVVGFSISMTMLTLKQPRAWFWLIGLMASSILGLGTGNRSFLAGICVAVVVLVFTTAFLGKLFVRGLVLAVVVIGGMASMLILSSLNHRLIDRFETDLLRKDWDTRYEGDAGILPGVRAALYRPILGSIVVEPKSGEWFITDGETFVQPHNSWVYLAASRGVFIFMIVAMAAVIAIFKLYNASKTATLNSGPLVLLVVFISGQAVCFTDCFLETPVMFGIIVYGLGLSHDTGSRAFAPPFFPRKRHCNRSDLPKTSFQL